MLAIAAFDIVAPMAEETKTPRTLVPRATIYVTIGAGLYWVFTSFGLINAVPASTMASYVNSGEFTPIYLSPTTTSAIFGSSCPDRHDGRVRGVHGDLDRREPACCTRSRARDSRRGMFAITDENKTPWNAQKFVLGCCVVLPILIGLYQDRNPLLAFGWIGEAYVFFVLIPYTLTCVANIFYHLRVERGRSTSSGTSCCRCSAS